MGTTGDAGLRAAWDCVPGHDENASTWCDYSGDKLLLDIRAGAPPVHLQGLLFDGRVTFAGEAKDVRPASPRLPHTAVASS